MPSSQRSPGVPTVESIEFIILILFFAAREIMGCLSKRVLERTDLDFGWVTYKEVSIHTRLDAARKWAIL